jgi:hypothetical protein
MLQLPMNPMAREQTEVHGGQRKEKETCFVWFENTKIINRNYDTVGAQFCAQIV